MNELEKNQKLFHKVIRRSADLIAIALVLVSFVFALRGFFIPSHMMLIIIVFLALTGIVLTIYKNYLRGPRGDVEPAEPAEHRPIEHIKSMLFLEIPIEFIAMGYFVLIGLLYTIFLLTGAVVPQLDLAAILLSGLIAFLLLFKWIMSLGITMKYNWRMFTFFIITLCITTALLILRPDAISTGMLQEAFRYTFTAHLLGLVLGLGGAIIMDLMIFHFLGNFSISNREAVIMHLVSQMIILGLAILIVSGFALMYTDLDSYLSNPRFLMKMTAVGVVTINGIVLNLYVAPKMELISLRKEDRNKNQTLVTVSFIVGAVSAVSWFSVFFLATIHVLESFTYFTMLLIYIILLMSAVGGGLFTKWNFERKAVEESE